MGVILSLDLTNFGAFIKFLGIAHVEIVLLIDTIQNLRDIFIVAVALLSSSFVEQLFNQNFKMVS